MDLLTLADANPISLPLWAVFAFAVAMYPIGLIFGCSPCCDPCACPSGESLPETVTVTLNGFTDYQKTYLTSLEFDSCFGSGASGRIEAPGHVTPGTDPAPDRGPVTAVSLAAGGSGYAKLGRQSPTVSVDQVTGSGNGGVFTVTLAQQADACGVPFWEVASVDMSGGTGYQHRDTMTFKVAAGDTQTAAASARFNRNLQPPTLSAAATGGTGAVLAVAGYFQRTTAPAVDWWGITGINVTAGGTGYTNGTAVTITPGTGDEEAPGASPISATIKTKFDPPSDDWTLTTDGSGTGAKLSMTLGPSGGRHIATSASVVLGGLGYAVGDTLTASAVQGTTFLPAVLTVDAIDPNMLAPADDWFLIGGGGGTGTGLELSMTLQKTGAIWEPTAVSVAAAGTGYAVDDLFDVYATEGATNTPSVVRVTAIGTGGAVTAVNLDAAGEYAGVSEGIVTAVTLWVQGEFGIDTGVVASVTVGSSGAWAKPTGAPVWNVLARGSYYRENAALPPYVAAVTVTIQQTAPSQGAGATITATVNSNTASADFGKITGLSVTAGGADYLAWRWTPNDCCGHHLNGRQFVLALFDDSNSATCSTQSRQFSGGQPDTETYWTATVPRACLYTHRFCGGWKWPYLSGPTWDRHLQTRELQLYVGYAGEGNRAVAELGQRCHGVSADEAAEGGTACLTTWRANAETSTCGSFAWESTAAGQPSITVTPGGVYDPQAVFAACPDVPQKCDACNVCCRGDEDTPDEIDVEITDLWTVNRPAWVPDFGGVYVAARTAPGRWVFMGDGVVRSFRVSITPEPCSTTCEQCLKKCRVVIGPVLLEGMTGGGIPWQYTLEPVAPENPCADCHDTPLCSPAGEVFQLTYAGEPAAGVEIL